MTKTQPENQKMKAGDILLFRKGVHFWESVIAWGTNSKYCHVAVCVSPEMNLAIEAMGGSGVRARDIRCIPNDYDIYRVHKAYNYDLNSTISYLVSKLNLHYDYLGVIFLGILKTLSKCNDNIKKVTNKMQKDNDYFCSELVYEAFQIGGGLDIVPNVSAADVTSPADIANSQITRIVESSF